MKIIGITGARRAGKDTFAELLYRLDHSFASRYSFADALKTDLASLFQKQFGVNVFELSGDIKEILRPILITYGCVWRDIDIDHWVKVVDANIETDQVENCVITDFRFESEIKYFREKYGNNFILVEIERIGGSEPTEEEKKHIPQIKKMVDYSLVWPTVNPDKRKEYVYEFWLEMINKKEICE